MWYTHLQPLNIHACRPLFKIVNIPSHLPSEGDRIKFQLAQVFKHMELDFSRSVQEWDTMTQHDHGLRNVLFQSGVAILMSCVRHNRTDFVKFEVPNDIFSEIEVFLNWIDLKYIDKFNNTNQRPVLRSLLNSFWKPLFESGVALRSPNGADAWNFQMRRSAIQDVNNFAALRRAVSFCFDSQMPYWKDQHGAPCFDLILYVLIRISPSVEGIQSPLKLFHLDRVEVPILALIQFIQQCEKVMFTLKLAGWSYSVMRDYFEMVFPIVQRALDEKNMDLLASSVVVREDLLSTSALQEQLDTLKFCDDYRKLFSHGLLRLDFDETGPRAENVLLGAQPNTVEHVMPQSSTKWVLEPQNVWTRNGWSDDLHKEWVNRWGNLCVINGPENSAISNELFCCEATCSARQSFELGSSSR